MPLNGNCAAPLVYRDVLLVRGSVIDNAKKKHVKDTTCFL